jgi:hypothetical protein
MTNSSVIPTDLKDLCFQSISQSPKPEAVDFFNDVFKHPPSEEQFLHKITQISNNFSPGPSGLSYNMIKAWPIEAKQIAY